MQQRYQDEPSPENTRYDEQTLRQAIRLADRLQEEHKDRYTAEDIEKIAAEIGVNPEFVRKALTEIEDKHETAPKPTAPPVTQQVNQALIQATKEVRATTNNAVQTVAKRLDEASVDQLGTYSRIWWSVAWTLMIVGTSAPGRHDELGVLLGLATYLGVGIYLNQRLKSKQEQLRRATQVPPVRVPDQRYSVEQSGVSRQELLAQMIEIQRRLEGERVRHAFLSVDVVHSTEMKRTADDLIVEYSFTQFRHFVESIVRAEGGIVQSTAGDGTMAMFEDDRAAVRAALRMQNEMPQFNAQHNRLARVFHIRCGINAGEIAIPHGATIGHLQSAVIDRAAALQKCANPDDIVVSGDLTAAALAELGRYGRYDNAPAEGTAAFSWRAGF